MKRLCVVMAVLLGACGGTEQVEQPKEQQFINVTTFQVGKGGIVDSNSFEDLLMTREAFQLMRGAFDKPAAQRSEVEVTASALWTGVGYSWNCYQDPYLYGGELKFFKVDESGECRGVGAGNNAVMGIGLDQIAWTNGVPLFHNTRYLRHKSYSTGASRRAAFHVNNAGGGGCVACFESLTINQVVLVNDVTKATGSVVIARFN